MTLNNVITWKITWADVEYYKKKKEEGNRTRADKQQVFDMLFSAFEKHQYYNIKDLVDITKQPVVSIACSRIK
ncbi:T2FB factor, partial [Polyodon spathula]|nr:T2FB factor [Polyodon spathula]